MGVLRKERKDRDQARAASEKVMEALMCLWSVVSRKTTIN